MDSAGTGRLIAELLRAASIETTARPRQVAEAVDAPLAPGARVYITALPGIGSDAVIAAATGLRRGGLEPVPHIGARYFPDRAALESLLARLAGEAGVREALVIAGDLDSPRGPFASSLDILESGALARHGIGRVGIAGYPEPHPRIPVSALDAAMAAKIARAAEDGLEIHVVTQFCFSAAPIRDWIARFAGRFPEVPVHVGLAGPAGVATLLKYGLACGLGPSLRALRRNTGLGRLLTEADPAPIIRALATDPATGPRLAAFHFFTFGGIGRTARWIEALARAPHVATGAPAVDATAGARIRRSS